MGKCDYVHNLAIMVLGSRNGDMVLQYAISFIHMLISNNLSQIKTADSDEPRSVKELFILNTLFQVNLTSFK